MEQRGERQNRESRQGGAFQVAGHDADPGVDLQDGFAERASVQEALQ